MAVSPGSKQDRSIAGEARWPMVGAVAAAITLTVLLPANLRLGPAWVIPSIEVVLLVALVVADPGAITRRSRLLRRLSVALVAVLAFSTLWATAELVEDLIRGGPTTDSASALLRAGAIIWASNCIAFALLYWELDSGGAAARAHSLPSHPDFAFVEHVNPELAPHGWRPGFIDYLYLAYTNATAFSPTDVMPLAPWGKVAMMAQSLISLVILALVVARAVNVLS